MFIFILILITIIAKTFVHYKYLEFREDSYFTGQSPILDLLMPQNKRAGYTKFYLSTIMFPVLSKDGDQKLRTITNYLVLFFYIQVISTIGFYILVENI